MYGSEKVNDTINARQHFKLCCVFTIAVYHAQLTPGNDRRLQDKAMNMRVHHFDQQNVHVNSFYTVPHERGHYEVIT